MVDPHEGNAEFLTEQEQAHWDRKSDSYAHLMIKKNTVEPATQQLVGAILKHLGKNTCRTHVVDPKV